MITIKGGKIIILVTVLCILFVVIAFITFFYLQNNKSTVTIMEKQVVVSDKDSETATVLQIQEEEREETVEEEFPINMHENRVQTAIHRMSHQKIRADEKWGFLPLTDERVQRLIEVVEANDYKHSETYMAILKRWERHDFSQADKDHNAIWTIQNGTIGKATGLLTIEEEKAFIRKHFKTIEVDFAN
ncbi:DUF6241 domain-containing protein [Lederbergia graminis]|uniref:DUF6241 domain-containing protein n=1 Tax=Lederbergia graminis TaxID=735518 RepID=A0ABW0LFW1_9BACI